MRIVKYVIAAGAICFASSIQASLVTQGYLSTYDDGSTNIITDSLNNVEYLKFDVLASMNYNDSIAALSTIEGGGWSLANSTDALRFLDSLFGGVDLTCPYNGTNAGYNNTCGILSGWYDGKLGNNSTSSDISLDALYFKDDSVADGDLIVIDPDGTTQIRNDGIIYYLNGYAADTGQVGISMLAVRPAEVPIPGAVWLFGSGLLGIIGLSKRKKKNKDGLKTKHV